MKRQFALAVIATAAMAISSRGTVPIYMIY